MRDLKQRLSSLVGIPRFRLKLFHGLTIMHDEECLVKDDNLNFDCLLLVFLQFEESHSEKDHAVIVACMQNDHQGLEVLLQEPRNPNFVSNEVQATPLYTAASRGNLECVSLILEAGASTDVGCRVSGETALFRSAWNGHLRVVRCLVE